MHSSRKVDWGSNVHEDVREQGLGRGDADLQCNCTEAGKKPEGGDSPGVK